VPVVDEMIANGERLFREGKVLDDDLFLQLFRSGAGSSHVTPDQLPNELLHGVELLKAERPPWEAEVPVERLAAAGFPILVISGGHSPAFEAVCDALANALSAERTVITGRGHTVPSTGTPYNERLESFLCASQDRYAAGTTP
jgi:pimeloyl-ACP methyl ester carboxylesterase